MLHQGRLKTGADLCRWEDFVSTGDTLFRNISSGRFYSNKGETLQGGGFISGHWQVSERVKKNKLN